MARGRPRKKVEPEGRKSDAILDSLIDRAKQHEGGQKEPEKSEKDDFVSLFEAARLLNVPEATIQLWFDHGHLTGQGQYGNIRISRGSLFGARIKKLVSGPMG